MIRKTILSVGAAALAATAFGVGAASAATVNTKANVVFIVDESGSMGGDQAFLQNTVVDALDAGLATAGVTDRKYGVVGFGGNIGGPNDDPRLVGGLTSSTGDTKTNLGNLTTSGGFEDGYAAIDFALNNLSFTSGAAVNFVLVTDEDRDVTSGLGLTFGSVKSSLTNENIVLNAVVNNRFSSGDGSSALGIDDGGAAYLADGSGGFTTATGGTAGSGSGSTKADYVDLALQTGGAAWDLGKLRAGGFTATSFANAFIDIKVQEITTQPPRAPVPLPAGGVLLLTALGGLGGLGGLRRKRRDA